MEIDWSFWFEAIRSVAIFIASCGVFVAGSALRTWKKQRLSNLAEEVIILAHKANDIIQHVRSPYTRDGEGSSRQQDEGEDEGRRRLKNCYFAPLERLDECREDIQKFFAVKVKADLYFQGEDVGYEIDKFRDVIADIRVAVIMLMDERIFRKDELHEEYIRTFWEHGEDEIKLKIDKATQNIEDKLKKYL